MIEEGKYIYSIIEENQDRRVGSIGINNREVNLLHYKDISAVVSSTPVINFDRLDKKEITEHVAVHQKVNEEVMKEYDLVPMVFGVIAPSDSEARRVLEKAYFQFKTALKKIRGKTEFAVQIFWNEQKILEDLVNANLEIQKLKKNAQSLIKGLSAKLKLGKLIFETLEQKRKEYLKGVEDSLKKCSLESQPGRLLEQESQGNKQFSDEKMIGNISFLIEKKAELEFDRKMQELGKKYGRDLRFKYVGPMPPYSFVNITLGLGNFEVVDGARRLLGLGQEATFEEIKKVYYKLAHRYHPDKYHQSDGEDQMKKISQAYSILESYCQSCDELLSKKNQKYSFREKEVKNSLIIK